MRYTEFFYRCSAEYLNLIEPRLRDQVVEIIARLRRRGTQGELNQDLTWLFASHAWRFSSFPAGMPDTPPADLKMTHLSKQGIKPQRSAQACLISRTLEHRWLADFATQLGPHYVYVEAQFGKKEAAVMDLCKLQIAHHEGHMSLGIVILVENPGSFFVHRRASVAGMADFSTVKELVPIIGLQCPIWLIGISG